MYIRVITPAGGPLPPADLPPTKGNSDYIPHFWIPPSFRGRKRENSRLNSAGDKNDQMSKQKYPTKIFIRVIWPGEKFPMKTCPEQENSGLTHPFRVNCTSSCRLENYFRDCICISNFKFRDSLYLLTTSYPNITDYYILSSPIPNWVSYIIPNTQTGLSKTTHFPDIPIWGVPNDPNCPFSNHCRPCVLSLTAAFKPKFPTSKDPFYTGEYFLKTLSRSSKDPLAPQYLLT